MILWSIIDHERVIELIGEHSQSKPETEIKWITIDQQEEYILQMFIIIKYIPES